MRRGIVASFFLTIALPAYAAEITVGGMTIALILLSHEAESVGRM
jgi:hypothetical protein